MKFRGDDTPAIYEGVEEAKDGWVFSVQGNGIGIDMECVKRIFTIFQRLHTRADFPETGMDLSTSKRSLSVTVGACGSSQRRKAVRRFSLRSKK